jgi:hypothetical protein
MGAASEPPSIPDSPPSMAPFGRLALVAVVLLVPQKERLNQAELAEIRVLVAAVDRAMKGDAVAESASIRWQPHFLRAPDGRTYVPYTIAIEDVPEDSFSSVALYVRVATRGDRTISTERDKRIGPTGADVPSFAYDAAAEASNRLRFLDRPDQKQSGPYPFEAAHFAPVWWEGRPGTGLVQRALIVPPGSYDLYLAVREREDSIARGQTPQASVLKRELDVPDFSTKVFSISSPILAARIDAIGRSLDAREQTMRPYAFGGSEITPVQTKTFAPSDTLTVLFFVYNAAMDRRGKPDVSAEFQFFRLRPDGTGDAVGPPVAQRFDAALLPAEFDLRKGHPLVPMQSLPLASIPPGQYRLEIRVTDRIASATASRDLQLAVR